MGNCVCRGINIITGHGVEGSKMVKVVTSNGGIMELYTPITVDFITSEFPGHGIFHSGDEYLSEPQPQPLLQNEELHAGEVYYLLPLNNKNYPESCDVVTSSSRKSIITRQVSNASEPEILPRQHNNKSSSSGGAGGVWKVRLVISPEQLSEILSEEALTEALIESLRTVAKCGNRVPSPSPSPSPASANSSHFKYNGTNNTPQ